MLEYFISTHGSRKGLADTALRTADSGYLTRRLIDVAQEVIVLTEDCETTGGVWIEKQVDDTLMTPFDERLRSRLAAAPVADPSTGEILIDRNEVIDDDVMAKLEEAEVDGVLARSPLVCEAVRGVCQMCYGTSLATMQLANMGEAVGIIAAQSIGEPGTQLTMRTFPHRRNRRVDITSGLPRVEELFEARAPKGEAVLSEIDGLVEVTDGPEGRTVTVRSSEDYSDEYTWDSGYDALVSNGDLVGMGTRLAAPKPSKKDDDSSSEEEAALQPADIIARVSGIIRVNRKKRRLVISWTDEESREYMIPAAAHITVRSEDTVIAGQALTSGPRARSRSSGSRARKPCRSTSSRRSRSLPVSGCDHP